MTRALLVLGRKLRAPLWILKNLAIATFDGDVARFADRHRTAPVRRFGWRCFLSLLTLLLYVGIVAINLLLGAALVVIPPLLITSGNLAAIWKGKP